MAGIRIEAEDMLLDGYRLESSNNFNFASGKSYTSLFAQGSNESATATTQFSGPSGTYDIVVAYFDEDDGVSAFNVKQNGNQIDAWRATNTSGGALPSAQSLTRRTLSGISLSTGDRIQLQGTEDGGEAARIDYIEFLPKTTGSTGNPPDEPDNPETPSTPSTPSVPSGSPIRVEAESMTLNGYRLESSDNFNFASGKSYTSLFAQGSNESATATTQFSGPSGTYDIVVAYFDEDDGVSAFNVKQNGNQIDAWRATNTSGGALPSAQSLTRRTLSGISLSTGDRIQLQGTEDGGEAARIDYIEFVPTGSTTPNPPTSSSPLAGSNGVLEIMPLGDSITRGEDSITAKSQQNGYRDDLAGMLNSAGIAFDFVGSQRNGSGFDSQHEGHGGWKISQLTNSVNGWLDSYKPEIILLQIGTNDMGFTNTPVGNAISQLGGLIDKIVSKRPAAQIIVSSIAPTNPANFSNNNIVSNFQQRVAEFNSRIPGLVSGRAQQGKKVKFANVNSALNPSRHLSSDGFHPNNSGYSQMAGVFYNAIANVVGTSGGSTSGGSGTSNPSPIVESDEQSPDDPISNTGEATGYTKRKGNKLTGSNKVDTIVGSAENELIRALNGNDILTGGGGRDIFMINLAAHGKDVITDFGSDDILKISSRGFGGGLQRGTSLSTSDASTGVLVSGSNPLSLGQSANFLYNTQTQILSFDRDGTGNRYGAVEIAQLTGVSALTIDQFQIA